VSAISMLVPATLWVLMKMNLCRWETITHTSRMTTISGFRLPEAYAPAHNLCTKEHCRLAVSEILERFQNITNNILYIIGLSAHLPTGTNYVRTSLGRRPNFTGKGGCAVE